MLITKQAYARQVLPIFQRPSGTLRIEKLRRHSFMAVPVQNPPVLLARLNSRRLHKRRRPPISGLTTSELACREWGLLASRDPPELELLRFLDSGGDRLFVELGPTLLVSYPRSGNTLVRTLLERVTGIVTGSDTRPDRSLSKELAEQHDLTGEGVTQGAFVKTHWPERSGNRIFVGKRAILLVRNPYDAIDSYWNMNATKSHTKSLLDATYEQFRDKWYGLVRNEIHIWNKFLDYWLNQDCSVLVVRFEDLIREPAVELLRMLEFALQTAPLSSFWMNRIRHATTGSNTERLGSYKPRSAREGAASIGKSIKNGHYTDEQLDYIRDASAEYSGKYLLRFGYDITEHGFPVNFVEGREPAAMECTTTKEGREIRVNDGVPVRRVDCPYGRLLQLWRFSVTNHDADPLPTVLR